MIKTYTYKLRPNKIQAKELQRLLDKSRGIYNRGLEQLIAHYRETGKHLNRFAQDKFFNTETCPNVPAQIVDATLDRLHRSFANFFRGRREGKNIGFPRFQSYGRYSSFSFNYYPNGGKVKDGRWYVRRNYGIKVILHRPFEGEPKFTRCLKKPSGWYVQVVCELPEVEPKAITKESKAIGLDVGLKWFTADSEGNKIEPPKCFRQAEWKLRQAHRRVSKKKKGSKRREKAIRLLGLASEKIANQRKDFIHKTARKYADAYDVVVVEDLNTAGMMRNHHLAKSISDASWGLFFSLLDDKLRALGKRLVKVPPQYTSQICSQCGAVVTKSLSQRTHYCPQCLYVEDRDVNAAVNILNKGLGQAIGEATPLGELLTREAQ